jgi:hypothetical protein
MQGQEDETMPRRPHLAPFAPTRTHITRSEVIELYREMEFYREALQECAATLDDWLAKSSEFAAEWDAFLEKGGATSDDLERYLNGKTFRHRPTRKRKHLRLITVNRKRQYRRLSSGDDAA